jgi:Tfp pilus assembly protein PilE
LQVGGWFTDKSVICTKKERVKTTTKESTTTEISIFSSLLLKQIYRFGQLAKLQVGGWFTQNSAGKEAQALIKNSIQGTRNIRSVGQMRRKFLTTCTIKGTRGGNLQADVLQYGRSMIEMLGVLAIIGVLSVGGIAGYSKAMMKVKINKTINQVSQISANIRTLYASQKNYNGLNDAVLKKAKIISDDMIGASHSAIQDGLYFLSETDLNNTFGGGFWALSYRDLEYSFEGFFLVLDGIPEDACMELLTLDWGSGAPGLRGIGLTKMSGIFLYSSDSYGVRAEDLPISVSLAASYCSGNDNRMSFGFE